MAISMTGFGRAEYLDEKFHFVVECKSINHKYLDVNIKMPRKISYLEEKMRNIVKSKIKRGRIEIFIKMDIVSDENISLQLDEDLACKYINILRQMKDKFDLIDDISVMNIAKFPDVVKMSENEENEDEICTCLEKALNDALFNLVDMRNIEGDKLSDDIKQRCIKLKSNMKNIQENSEFIVREHKEKLESRIKEILNLKIDLNEERLMQEVAYFADKSDISEEIVRFNSHIIQLENTIDSKEAIGRKLDFLIQEINREANTIASKSSNINITNLVVDIKSELEKIREQVQNIE